MTRLYHKTQKLDVEKIEFYVPVTNVCLDLTSICEEFCQNWKWLLESETRSAFLDTVWS